MRSANASATLASMTGFGRSAGGSDGFAWAWELRSVNGRGFELRLRLPAGFDMLEAGLRDVGGKLLKRGNVTANLTVKREDAPKLVPDPAALQQVMALALELAMRIPGAPPPRAEALLALPGVLRPASTTEDEPGAAAQLEAVRAGFAEALDALVVSRQGEGARLAATLTGLLDEITVLRDQAAAQAADQPAAHRARMLQSLRDMLSEVPSLPEDRIAQEVALLAARSDVREELDRLDSHIQAARLLLAEAAPIGRRLDFLVQEFNREANTLCSKSASILLTATGLKLKAAIEQLREQVQNIE
jgi:uncharacterized protein (TIGR00255 family)